ncbi:MAG TPA: ABC transporter permease [Vicinamibacterales bacterium]|nr:ABC transporter permease [Vicinamibacterales bacterium]
MSASAETRTASPAEPAAAADVARGEAAVGRGFSPGKPAGYAGLVWTLVRTDFKVRYHGTAGGFVWALLRPLTMFALLMGVFSFLFASDPNYKLNLIIGLFLWDFFAEGTKAGLMSLDARGFLLTKARCPAWVLVVTSMSNALITLVVFTVIIITFLVGAGRPPSPAAIVLFLGYAAALVLIVAGFSLAASVLFLRYRDLNQVWDLAAQAGFFVAPIIYPIAILPERYHIYLYFWPPTPIIQFARSVLVDGRVPTMTAHAYLAAAVVLSLTAGALVYRRLAPRAAEYL